MRFRCVVSFRTSRSKTLSTWKTSIHGEDLVAATANTIAELKRRHRRAVTVVGIYLHAPEAVTAG